MKQVGEEERLLVEMLCKRCGEETPDNSAFCESCGRAISKEASGEEAEALSDVGDGASPDDVDGEHSSAVEGESSDTVAEQQESAFGEKSQDVDVNGEKTPNAAKEAVAEEILDAYEPWLSFGTPAGAPVEFASEGTDASIPGAIRRSKRDEPLVDPPTPPNQLKLGAGRIVVVAVVAVLFAAALILLTCAILMRVMGL